ncbi:ABC transporter substrate-binding protein [Gorillibacterium massiliense]|uniref:ABC transporter substrate-binding protein n=1 Tax=Gorillibacterium massiliense TaxID=1280390 RepID=UPI0004B0BEAD|nr:ABC transporter substrate-binding protein [Gorillibacterium massiliense]
MKKIALLALSSVFALSLTACGSGAKDSGNKEAASASPSPASTKASETAAATKTPKKDITIKVFQFKVEIDEKLKAMAKEYEKETGVKVDIETHGGGEDYGALLRATLAAGEEPEIFNNGGFASLVPYMDRATDLSNESWVKDVIEVAKAPTTVDGKLYGMPMNVEGYGLIYNKDLFAKAGIDKLPTTLTELEATAKKLKDAGITPFMLTNEWWSLGIHLANVGISNQENPAQFVEDVKAGKATFKDNATMKEWVKLVELMFKYGQTNALTTDYNSQVTGFASGQAAMMQQGNWVQSMIDGVTPNMNIGTIPLPINDTTSGYVYTGVPNNWIVNSKSAHPDEAKKFLEWMVTSDTGKHYIATEFKFIPALTSIPADSAAIGPIATELNKLQADHPDRVKGWHWDRFPDGTTQGLGAAMQEFMGKRITSDQLLEKFDKAVADIMAKQK